jgi:hypothetical protein
MKVAARSGPRWQPELIWGQSCDDDSASPASVLGRAAKHQADWFRLHKEKREAVCAMFSHQFGWELRLTIDGELIQSQVCRSQEEVLNTWETWLAAMKEKGWQ